MVRRREWWVLVATISCRPSAPSEPAPTHEVSAPSSSSAEAEAEVPEQVAMLEALRAEDPRAGLARYVLARYYARTDRAKALELLGELLAIEDWDYALLADDFPALVGDEDYERLAEEALARVPKVEHGPVAFELDAVDLLPEGVAWDPGRKELLLGSAYRAQVFAADAGGKTRAVIEPKQDGLRAVLGIDVDPEGERLWVTSNGMPMMEGFDAERDGGPAEIYGFELATGATVGRWPAPEVPSLVNDLVALSDGRVVVTDSARGTVLLKPADAPTDTPMVALAPAQTFLGPNGLVALDDEAAIVVADFHGLHRMSLDDGTVEPLEVPPGVVSLGGIDGLERRGTTLVGIQNIVGPGRVWAVELGSGGRSLVSARILDDDHPRLGGPTTGAIDGDRFLYLANASLQQGPQGMTPAPQGARHVILELSL